MTARFEIVRTDAEQPWHVRIRAGNGRITWTSENYHRRGSAMKAIRRHAAMFGGFVADRAVYTVYTYVDDQGRILRRVLRARIVDIDEREAVTR